MNKDQIKGKAKQIQGEVIDQKGDFTNNPSDDIRGKAKKIEGKVQEAYGDMKADIANERSRRKTA